MKWKTEAAVSLLYITFTHVLVRADTCEVENGGCSQLCLVDGVGQRCRCYFGFQLDQDGITCTSSETLDQDKICLALTCRLHFWQKMARVFYMLLAERVILSLSLSLCLFFLSVCCLLSLSLSISLLLSVSVWLSVSVCLYLCLSVCLSVCLSFWLAVSPHSLKFPVCVCVCVGGGGGGGQLLSDCLVVCYETSIFTLFYEPCAQRNSHDFYHASSPGEAGGGGGEQ